MDQLLEQLLGPTGVAVLALVVAAALWRDHLRADAEDRKQRDIAIEGWRAQTAANQTAADAWEQQTREQAERHRRDDA